MTGVTAVTELADGLRDRRIASVCSGRDSSALAAAQALAAQLGVVHRSVEGLEPPPARRACAAAPGAGSPGAEVRDSHVSSADFPGAEVPGADSQDAGAQAARHRAALDALADLHRGETVLVVVDAAVLTTLWPASPSPDGGDASSSYRLVTVQVDGDGWRLLGRPGGG